LCKVDIFCGFAEIEKLFFEWLTALTLAHMSVCVCNAQWQLQAEKEETVFFHSALPFAGA